MRSLQFGAVADVYERARPRYPDALVTHLLDVVALDRPRVLDVGAGTGKATRMLLERGLEVVAIEPSAEMASIIPLGEKTGRLSVVVEEFESWDCEPATFDLVVSAQAWHWVNRDVRHVKANALLRTSGVLAVWWSHPLWADASIHDLLAGIYRKRAPELFAHGPWLPGFSGPHGFEKPTEQELAGLFGPVQETRYRWEERYSTERLVDLFRSLPEHAILPAARRAMVFEAIRTAVDALGGEAVLPLETRLYASRRLV